MAHDHRMLDANGAPIPFTCENRRYHTNLNKRGTHGLVSTAPGSVLDAALINSGGYSLWLEHVSEKGSLVELYWLMWYDNSNGQPTIPLSGVFAKDELKTMIGNLIDFTP